MYGGVPQQDPKALWSMITGIASLLGACCCGIFGVALGITALVLMLNTTGFILGGL